MTRAVRYEQQFLDALKTIFIGAVASLSRPDWELVKPPLQKPSFSEKLGFYASSLRAGLQD